MWGGAVVGILLGAYAIACLVIARDTLRNILDRKRLTYGDLISYILFFPGALLTAYSIAIAWVIVKIVALIRIVSIAFSSKGVSADAPVVARHINKVINSEIVPRKKA